MACIRCSFKVTRDSVRTINEETDQLALLNCRPKIRANIEYVVKVYNIESLDLVLEILWYMGINIRISRIKSAWEYVLRRIVAVFYVVGVIYSFSIRMCAFVAYNSGTMIITELLAFLCSICLWISINLKRQKIVDLKGWVNEFQNRNEEYFRCFGRKAYVIKALCFSTIMLPIFSGAVSMLISKVKHENIDSYLSFLAFGCTLEISVYYKYIALFLLRSSDLIICFVSPQISCLLFSVLCHNVCCYMKDAKIQIPNAAQGEQLSGAMFIRRYKKVKRMVRDLEKAISVPMFFAMAFLLCQLFALMSNSVSIVRHKSSLASLVIVLCALITTGFHLVFVICRASSVEEKHRSLVRTFIELPEENVAQAKELLSVMKLVAFQDTLQITAWGMFPIKRGFFLTIIGTLATYGVLLVQFT